MQQFDQLVEVIKALRSPNGCPWDKEQTFQSLTPFIIEEAYEMVDAIQHKTNADILEELGDVLLQVVLYGVIAEEDNLFTIADIINSVKTKMIRRHPHVFADTKVANVQDVWKNWEQIKKTEQPHAESILDSVPQSLPALLEATKLQKKASRMGFDWPDRQGPLEKIKEEIEEINHEIAQNDKEKTAAELGDLLFSIVNFCRKLEISPEEALKQSNHKFKQRFKFIEQTLEKQNQKMTDLSLEELDKHWEAAKKA